ncbi:MAG: Asp-tRNA(Asn)/Glu-tRNA(Gln) amidotransferase subunit GatA [Acidobacteriota bacterium]|jgi:aspartyl-tRNA(Asn)/glutamyl-tRNA(Gln) amidotransferase subunit A|nr:Asp-tRNA(Asn)/Glu-tRNA(Gln) amidotransferase subunit GatA [Acidobacteriota bacterium]
MDIRDAYAIRNAVNAREISAREMAETALGRIEAVDGTLKAFLAVEPERVLARAEEIDRKVKAAEAPLPLAGVPIAIKDNLCTKGLRTTCASKILENWIPPYDATAVARLEAAGAIVVGKTNLDEFAMGSSTENSAFQTTHNPYDLDRIPGGSSGGSAVAVAAGMATLALGSETGGSVRQPASFCNITGLKPTYGRVSRYGLVAYASSLDCVAPMGNSPRDVALLLSQIAGRDGHDSTSSPTPVPDYADEMSRPVQGMRLGVPKEFFGAGLDSEVKAAIEAGIKNAESLGCELVEVSLPHTPYAIADYYIIAPAEASSNLARYDGVKYGYRVPDPKDLLDMYQRTRSIGFGAEVRRRIMIGTYALSSGYYDAYYGRAMKVRTLIKRDYDLAFEKVDALVSPVSPTPAFQIGEKSADPLSMYLSDIYTVTANLAGIPGVSIPCCFTQGGLPIGLQLLGPQFQEGALLRLAQGYLDAFAPEAPALKV